MKGQTGNSSIILVLVLALLTAGALAWAVYNQSLLNQIKGELKDTRDQLAQVRGEAEELRSQMVETTTEGIKDIGQALQGVEDPALRLQLFLAYAERIREVLTPDSQEELDKIVVYVEKDPVVLVQPSGDLPAAIRTAINEIKQELSLAKTTAVVTTKFDQAIQANSQVGEEVTLTGLFEYVETDNFSQGGVFRLTDESDGQVYYFTFNATNSAQYQSSLSGEVVEIVIEVTGEENGYVLYEVVSGPELVTETSPSPEAAEE